MTPLDKIKNSFAFLTIDFGFKLIDTKQKNNFKENYLAIYRNDNSKLQLEISADEQYFHCEIRRLINGQPAKYSDKDNCIGFESLAIFESDNNYEHFDYFAGGSIGLNGVLNNTSNLFKRHKKFFTSDNWIDTKKIQQLEDADFEKKFGQKPDRSEPSYFKQVKKQAVEFLTDKGYELILDSDELAPYDSNGTTKNIILSNQKKTIKFSAEDWRDFYYIFYIEINNKRVFEIDLSKNIDLDKAVSETMNKLRELTEKTTTNSTLPKAGQSWWQKLFGFE